MQSPQEPAPDQEGSGLRASAQHGSSPSGDTVSLERAPGGMQQTPPGLKQVTARHAQCLVRCVRPAAPRTRVRCCTSMTPGRSLELRSLPLHLSRVDLSAQCYLQ